jgi:hypothetical protein
MQQQHDSRTNKMISLKELRHICISHDPADEMSEANFRKLITPNVVLELINKVESLNNLVVSLENEHNQVVSDLTEEIASKTAIIF